MNAQRKASILVVEDENIVAMDLLSSLEKLQYSVVGVAAVGEDAIDLANRKRPDLILMDIQLRGAMDGIVAAQRIRESFSVPIVYLTAYSDEATIHRAHITHPLGYILKPFEERDLEIAIQVTLVRHDVELALGHGDDAVLAPGFDKFLERSKDLSAIDLGDYVRDLVRQLVGIHGVDPPRIAVEMDLAIGPLPIALAILCGSILNEVLSNAMTHAFPAGRRGTIRIELGSGDSSHDLVVRDDGIGMPAALDADANSWGLRLVRTLADQIGGKLDIRTDVGTEVRVHIPREPKP